MTGFPVSRTPQHALELCRSVPHGERVYAALASNGAPATDAAVAEAQEAAAGMLCAELEWLQAAAQDTHKKEVDLKSALLRQMVRAASTRLFLPTTAQALRRKQLQRNVQVGEIPLGLFSHASPASIVHLACIMHDRHPSYTHHASYPAPHEPSLVMPRLSRQAEERATFEAETRSRLVAAVSELMRTPAYGGAFPAAVLRALSSLSTQPHSGAGSTGAAPPRCPSVAPHHSPSALYPASAQYAVHPALAGDNLAI